MRRIALFLSACMLLCRVSPALASNAVNLIGYDARSAGMGGANTALGHSTLSMAGNPAGLTQYEHRVDANLAMLVPLIEFSDRVEGAMALNTGVEAEKAVFPLFGIGWSTHIAEGLYGGIGLIVQGGMGSDFKSLATFADDDPTAPISTLPGGALYDTHSQLMYLKLTPTLAYQFADWLSVGASLHIGFSKLDWSHGGMQFAEPDGDHLYVPHKVAFDSNWATSVAGRFGIMTSFFDDRLRFGATYMTRAKFDLSGKLTVDDMLEYDASSDDFGWAQEVSFGAAARLFDKRLLIAADVRWANWSQAVGTVTFDATTRNPSQTPAALQSLSMPFYMNWEDVLIEAVGIEFEAMQDRLWVRAGYNHGNSAVTETGISPLFQPISEHQVTAGLGVRIWDRLTADLAFEWAPKNTVKSDASNQMALEPSVTGVVPDPNNYRMEVSMQHFTGYLSVGYEF